MSYINLNDDRTRIAAIAGAAVLVVGGLYAYNKYTTQHEDEWNAKKAAAGQKLAQGKEAVKETAHKVANKVTGNHDANTIARAGTPAAKAAVTMQPLKTTPAATKVVVAPAATASTTTKTTVTPVTASVDRNGNATATTSATRTTTTTVQTPAVLQVDTEPQLKAVKERTPVLQEVVHPVEMEEIQPIIYREVKKTEVHQITQPIYEEYTAPLKEVNRELVAEHKPTLYEDKTKYTKEFEGGLEKGTQQFAEIKKTTVLKPAIIQEVIKTDIVEVIQPVIHRDTVAPTVIHTSQPIYEKLVEQPTVVQETRKPLILTHEQVQNLQAASNEGQLNMMENFSSVQKTGGVVDHKYDENFRATTATLTPAAAVEEKVTTTTTSTTTAFEVLPAGSVTITK